MEIKKGFKLGKIFQKGILIEILKYSHLSGEVKKALFGLNSASRKYLNDYWKIINRRLKHEILVHLTLA